MEGWTEINKELPPLNTMVEVKTKSMYWATHFDTSLIRAHVIYKWKISHWKLIPESENQPKKHEQIIGKY